jgi:uncharacterized protein YcgI (DUF1989 family)
VTAHNARPAAIRIEPQTGTAITLRRGQRLRIVDPCGEQVSDVVAYAAGDHAEALSSGRTLDYNSTLRLTKGHVLYSNRGNAMMTIVEDDVGVHDFLLAPCSPEMFRLLHGIDEYHPSCFENLASALAPHGIASDAIPTAFNVFMHVSIDQGGALRVLPPLSRAGDAIELRAEIDLLVAMTACSAEQSNNGSFKPMDYEIIVQ